MHRMHQLVSSLCFKVTWYRLDLHCNWHHVEVHTGQLQPGQIQSMGHSNYKNRYLCQNTQLGMFLE